MSNLSGILGGSSSVVDPRKEGLPLFGLLGQDGSGNQNWNYRVFDSAFRNVGSPWGSFSNSTTNYRAGILADPSHGYSMNDHGDNVGAVNFSSEGYNSYSAFNRSGYQVDQYPHAMYYTASREGHISWQSYHNMTGSFEFQVGWTKINQVLPEGCRPRRIFCNRSFSLREQSGNNQLANMDHYDYSSHLDSTQAANDIAVGTGYNEKTKTLVMIHSNGETSNQPKTIHIFKSAVDLNSVTRIKDFFDNLTSTEYFTDSWSQQDNKDHIVIVGNNGFVGFSRKEGNGVTYGVFDCNNGTGLGTTGASRQFGSWQSFQGSTTTSYGANQGAQYCTKFNTTWDNTWGLIYNPYYYYGVGIAGWAVNLENPRKFIGVSQTKSDRANPYLAHGRTGFHGGYSENTDGTTYRTYGFAFDPTDSDHTVNTKVYKGNSDGNNVIPTSNSHQGGTYSNGSGVVSLDLCYTGITGGYHSTCYPLLTNINWWGAYGSADASYGGK
jgi:hypothetical protein